MLLRPHPATYQSPLQQGRLDAVSDLTGIKGKADKGLPSVNAHTPIPPKNAPYLWGRVFTGSAIASTLRGLNRIDGVSTQSGYVDSSQAT